MRLLQTLKITGAQAESLFLFFLFVSFGLCLFVILIRSLTFFSFIPNPTAISSLCISIANFLAYIVVAIKYPSPSDGDEAHKQKSSTYRQYWMFGLHVITTLLNAGFCAAQFIVGCPEQVEVYANAFCRKIYVFLRTPSARLALVVGVVLELILLAVGVVCLFFPDLLIQREILWLLPSLMHCSQLLVYTAIYASVQKTIRALSAGKVARANIFFYVPTTVSSAILGALGVVYRWRLTFVEQYIFLLVMHVWVIYRVPRAIYDRTLVKDDFGMISLTTQLKTPGQLAFETSMGAEADDDTLGKVSEKEEGTSNYEGLASDACPKTPPLLHHLSSPPTHTRKSASISLSAAGKVVFTMDKPKGNRLSRFFSTKLFGNWFGSFLFGHRRCRENQYSQNTPSKCPSSSFYAGEADPFQSFSPSDSKSVSSCFYVVDDMIPYRPSASLTEQKETTSVAASHFDTRPATSPPFSQVDLEDYVTQDRWIRGFVDCSQDGLDFVAT
ncbi:hypothetical protein LXA43DRAFT_1065953 [Ganoderma leucocontextum]|nr:hypothetical protein LXA43DRAFT_1065953 [Ganoderma leucocontextum]